MKKRHSLTRGTPRFAANRSLKALLGTLALAGGISTSLAVNIVNDTWKDATWNDPAQPVYSEEGNDADADGNTESAWMLSNGGSMIPNGSDYILRTPQPSGSMSMTTYFTSNAPVTLASTGEKLRVTWKFKPSGTATDGNTSQNFRLCIVDTQTARLTATNGAPGNGVYPGYAMFMNATTNLGGGYFQLKERIDPTTNAAFLSSSGVWTTRANDTNGAAGIEGWIDGTEYTYIFEATLLSGGSLEILSKVTGANIGGSGELALVYVDDSPNTLTYDTFGVRPSNNTQTFTNLDTTLFRVELIPASCVPTAHNVTGGATVCSGGTGPVGLSGSDTGVDYHLLVNSTPTGTILPGTGSALNFGLQGVGTYTVFASNTTISCEGLMTGSAIIAQYADPVVTSDPSPANAQNTFGDTRVFAITATGPGLTYKWRKDGFEIGDTANRTGTSTATLTMDNLTALDSGYYDCVVSNSPCAVSVTSAGATLTVSAGSGLLFRTVSAGPSPWYDANAWESSSDGGGSWTTPAGPPSNLDSNIVIRAGHTILVQTPQTVDQVTIEAGATLQLQGGDLTINNGVDSVDFNVLGTLEVTTSGGNLLFVSAALQFGNGAVFHWNDDAAPVIPMATWLDGSTCRISQISSSATSIASGIGGQDFYDLIYDTTSAGQTRNCRLNIRGNTVVRRNFSINMPDTTGAKVYISDDTNGVMTVGGDMTLAVGGVSDSNVKILLNSAAGNATTIKLGGDFSVAGYIDGFGSSTTHFEFNGTGAQSLSMPVLPYIINSGTMHWLVDSGSAVSLANDLDGFSSFTNKGTLTFGSNMIIRGTTLALDAGGTINANGTNTIVTNIASLVAGGTINLGALPTFSGGESFQLIEAGAYSGSFNSILPATPGAGLTWGYADGVLSVVGGTPTPTNLTFNLVGSNQLELTWPNGQGWKLQTQTNTLGTGLATNWSEVVGASSPYTNTLSPANPAVFFRLVAP